MNEVLFSSTNGCWETPQDFFDNLDAEFHFTIDVAALPENAKCNNYYTPEDNALLQPWTGTVWCNPPYGRRVGDWVQKASDESTRNGNTVVMLLPARVDTQWFHDYIYGKAEVRFVRGRLKFGGSVNAAPFPSMVVVFRGGNADDT